MGHHLITVRRTIDSDTNSGATLRLLNDFGTAIISAECPWVSLGLGTNLLTPLLKKATGTDARPVSAKDIDISTFLKAAQRSVNSPTRNQVAPQQLAVGVSGGVNIKAWGIKLIVEQKQHHGEAGSICKDDRMNAHNTFSNKAVIADIREAAIAKKSLAQVACLADAVLRLKSSIYTRSAKNYTGLKHLCDRMTGGEQGNATTNIFYPLAIDKSLKETERKYDVTGSAIQDDSTIIGKTDDIFKDDGARASINQSLADIGNELREDKAEAYGLTPADREHIPAHIKQSFYETVDPSSTVATKHYGLVDCGVPIGSPDFITSWLVDQATSICGDIDKISASVAELSPQAATAVTAFSLQSKADFIMATNLPSQTRDFAARIDAAVTGLLARLWLRHTQLGLLLSGGDSRPGPNIYSRPSITPPEQRRGGDTSGVRRSPIPQLHLQLTSSDDRQ